MRSVISGDHQRASGDEEEYGGDCQIYLSTFTNYYVGTNKRSDMTVKTLRQPDVYCGEHGIIRYLIDPGKPSRNGTVERSHREDNRQFYRKHSFSDFNDLRTKIRRWNNTYNNLEHCTLNGKTPKKYYNHYNRRGCKKSLPKTLNT